VVAVQPDDEDLGLDGALDVEAIRESGHRRIVDPAGLVNARSGSHHPEVTQRDPKEEGGTSVEGTWFVSSPRPRSLRTRPRLFGG
jgi:hypothetical protein